jgi:hypothetical protein
MTLGEFVVKLATAAADAWGWGVPWIIQTDTEESRIELKVIDHGTGVVPGFMWTGEFIELTRENLIDHAIERGIESIKEQMCRTSR